MNWNILTRQTHYWGAIICAFPVVIILVTGILLQIKKSVTWIQPATLRGSGHEPGLSFDAVLAAAKAAPQAGIQNWGDIDRLDVRPERGIIKIQAKNHWEIQIDHQTGEQLQIAYRRSDLIESIHDGSFFSDIVKNWVFIPSAFVLLVLWLTGIYLFVLPLFVEARRKRRLRLKKAAAV